MAEAQDKGTRTWGPGDQRHRWLRPVVQWAFLLLVLIIGAQFTLFVWQLERGLDPTFGRPPGVEAFLPISALISLRYWLLAGVFNTIHPSGLVLLLVICATAVILKKGFCGWVCPFGLLGDHLERVHRLVLGRRLSLPRVLDYPLRSLKYLLLLFFLRAVFVRMDAAQAGHFIYSPYNRIADVKMLKFFTGASETTGVVLAGLLGLSLLIPYFWCRYLCPYGAMLGALSLLSPFKVRRDSRRCTGCQKCTEVCPARIRVHTACSVSSDECHACMRCIDACPVDRTLRLSAAKGRWPLSKPVYAALLVLLFVAPITVARVAGYWHTSISTAEYRIHLTHLDHPYYQHDRGTVPDYDWDELGVHGPASPAGRPHSAE